MKANAGGPVTGSAIIGRQREIGEMWDTLARRSMVLAAERRVGKTSLLRKMSEHPRDEWVPLFCLVESDRAPIDCVQKIYSVASDLKVRSSKGTWLGGVKALYAKISGGTEIAGWKLPQVQNSWKALLVALVEDIVQNTDNRLLIILDEFPMLVSNIINDHTPAAGMQFLDLLREIRQKYEPSGRMRLVLSGSIGLHLILADLDAHHGYRGKPINNMDVTILSGMSEEDTGLMCKSYLTDEGITMNPEGAFAKQMFKSTDGLPIYIQYVCEEFQSARKTSVSPADIETTLRAMMDSTEVQWFEDAAQRIQNYYARLNADRYATHILRLLAKSSSYVSEDEIVQHVRSQMSAEYDEPIRAALELLRKDHYVVRKSTSGRRYRFKYELMRKWWKINRG